jgi:hypothetical protein
MVPYLGLAIMALELAFSPLHRFLLWSLLSLGQLISSCQTIQLALVNQAAETLLVPRSHLLDKVLDRSSFTLE